MFRRAFCYAILAALAGCGRVGIDLLDLSAGLHDGGAHDDAEVGPPDTEGGVNPPRDASLIADSSAGEGGVSEPADASVDDAAASNDAATPGNDAQVLACMAGYADCNGSPQSCETQLGTVSNCASCGNVCPANGGTATCNANTCGAVCNVTGTYAVKLAVNVSWPTGLLNAGSGVSYIHARLIMTQAGNTLSGTFLPCSFSLPDFALNPLVANELYQLAFPNTMFDRTPSLIPTTPITLTSATGFAIGSPFSLPTVGLQVGSNLSNPASDAWPAASALPTSDMDGDGKAGVTGLYSAASGYSFPRANVSGTQRSDRAYTGARFVMSASGTTTSCNEFNGSATFTSFDTHIVGCRISTGAVDCTTAQRDQTDMGRPGYVPGTASLRGLKIAAGSTCAQVRAALP